MSKDLNIVIVEDEVLIAEYIKDILNEEGYENVYATYSVDKALSAIETYTPKIVLLDININGKDSGIVLAKQISEETKVIYLTAQNDKATIEKALATNPEAYLTKPIKTTDLLASIHLTLLKLKPKSLVVKDGYNSFKLNYDQILYINSDRNYIDIYTTDKKITVRSTLDSFLSELDDSIFKKVHRSYIVNTNKITKVSNAAVFLNHIEIPISKNCDVVI